jgi:hypothetical protein
MKRSTATGYPFRGASTDGPGRQPCSPAWALLAVGVLAPALAGCPGHLEEIGWITAGQDAARVTPGPEPLPTPDVAPAPAPAPPKDAAPAAVPPMVFPRGQLDPLTCAQPAEILNKIFMPACAPCHSGMTPPAGLDLGTMGAKLRLVGIVAKNMTPACAGKPLVAADLTSGVFLDKIQGATCGTQMPKVGTPLNAMEVQCIKDWLKPPVPVDSRTCAQAAEITNKILVPRCGGCHTAANAANVAGLDLATMGAKVRLLGVASKSRISGCAPRPLVTTVAMGGAQVPDGTGVLFDKLTGTMCGNQMPFNNPPLPAEELWCIKEWIKPGLGGTFPGAAPPPPVTPDAGVALPPDAAPPVDIAACANEQEIRTKIFQPICGNGACHGAVNPTAGLDLVSANVKNRLLDKPSVGCAGKPLALRDGTGALFDKLGGPSNCGTQMPLGFPPLSQAQIDCIRAWIKQ